MSEPVQTAASPQTEAGGSGREKNGTFAKGNPGGPGNPFARQVAALRKALLDCVTPEDIKAIAAKLRELAKGGDMAASKLLFAYTIGKPKPAVEPDHLDVEEWEHLKTTAFLMKDLPKAMGPGPEFPLTVARTVRPGMTSGMEKLFAKALREPERLPELVANMDKDPSDARDVEVAPSTNGSNRLKTPSPNGSKRPSENGGNRRLENGKMVPA